MFHFPDVWGYTLALTLERFRYAKQSTKLITTKSVLVKLYFNFLKKFDLISSMNLQQINYQILIIFEY